MRHLIDIRAPLVTAGLLVLAACSGGPRPQSGLKAPSTSNSQVSGIDAIAALLDRGDEAEARKRLKVLLKREPMNASARLLSDSIERDPKELLGPSSYPYTVRPGDTITLLADRLLGNRLKSYQLLRYNGLKAPVTLVTGQTLRIPGELPRAEPRHIESPGPRPAPVPSAPRAKPLTAKPASPASGNPIAARQLHAAGLTALNQGAVDRAVVLLRRAAALDPGNAVMARDVVRAERIAATVRARR